MPHRLALLLVACSLIAGCASRPAAVPETPRRYTVLMATTKAGTEVVTTRGGEVVTDYEYNDRGRGPKTHTVMRLDGRGLPRSTETTGTNYYKQQVEERFSTDANGVSWKNTAEAGTAAAGGFYASMYGPPEESAVMARALLRNGGHLPLLPAGEASIRKAGDATVRGTHVAAYELSGLDFTPSEVWLDDDLNFFGSVSPYQSTIREGFEGDVAPLIEAQDARSRERIEALAVRYMHVPTARRLSVVNARVFDPRTGLVSEPTIVNVEGNRIVSIGSPEERNAAEVIDGGGRVMLPGVWDMHRHLSEADGLLDIAAGVTSVRDLGNDPDFVMDFKTKIEEGKSIGPRVVLAGVVDGPGPYQAPTKELVSTREEALQAVDFYADRKYEGLKIYSSVKPELVPLLAKRAHERGMRVSGHVPAGMRATDAIDAGYDEIQHANMILLNFMPDVTATQTPARFTEVAKRAADLDLQSAEVQAFVAKLRDRGTVVDPTLALFENMFTARAGTMSPSYAAVADRLPPQVRRGFLTGGLPLPEGPRPEGMDERYRASFQRMLDLVAELHRSGVRIVAGTDSIAGFTLHRELELYVKAGIPAPEVLRIATLVPAQILKREADLGTIEPGKLADFILVDGDPTVNISDIRRIVKVVKDGIVYDPKELYHELGVN